MAKLIIEQKEVKFLRHDEWEKAIKEISTIEFFYSPENKNSSSGPELHIAVENHTLHGYWDFDDCYGVQYIPPIGFSSFLKKL